MNEQLANSKWQLAVGSWQLAHASDALLLTLRLTETRSEKQDQAPEARHKGSPGREAWVGCEKNVSPGGAAHSAD